MAFQWNSGPGHESAAGPVAAAPAVPDRNREYQLYHAIDSDPRGPGRAGASLKPGPPAQCGRDLQVGTPQAERDLEP